MSEKPVRPDDSDCCGSGCKLCVFDVYEERLRKWESKCENFIESRALDQIKYLPFLINGVQSIGDFLKVFEFQAVTLKKENMNSTRIENAELAIDFEIFQEPLKIKAGDYLILKGMYETEIISRSYTPVLDKDTFEKGKFQIIISLQPHGKMCNFLEKLQINDIVFWRGPFQEFSHDFSSFQHVLLFGGGTGIVPLYNIAKTIVENDKTETWVNVFASFKTIDSIILRKEFGRLRDFWNFQMKTFITNQNHSNYKLNYNESIIFFKINEAVIEEEISKYKEGEVFVIICGPDGFNHFVMNALRKFGINDENIFIFW